MEFERLLDLFRKQQGRTLIDVWTQSSSTMLLPDTQDRPVHEAERRIILDFKDEETGGIQSVCIHVVEDDSGFSIRGISEMD